MAPKHHLHPSVVDRPGLQPVRLGEDMPLRMTAKTFIGILTFVVGAAVGATLWANRVDNRMGRIEDRVALIDAKMDAVMARYGVPALVVQAVPAKP